MERPTENDMKLRTQRIKTTQLQTRTQRASVLHVRDVVLTFGFVENNSCEVLNPKLGLVVVLGWDVVCVEFVLKVEFVQHGGVCALRDAHKETGKTKSSVKIHLVH